MSLFLYFFPHWSLSCGGENDTFHFAFKWRSTLKRIVILPLCVTLSDFLLFCGCLVCNHEFDLPCSCSGLSFSSWNVKISSPRLRSVSIYLPVISSFLLSSYRLQGKEVAAKKTLVLSKFRGLQRCKTGNAIPELWLKSPCLNCLSLFISWQKKKKAAKQFKAWHLYFRFTIAMS